MYTITLKIKKNKLNIKKRDSSYLFNVALFEQRAEDFDMHYSIKKNCWEHPNYNLQ